MASTPLSYIISDSMPRRRRPRFSYTEVHILLDEIRKNRHIVVGKFNRGVSSEIKKRTWAKITARVNEIGNCDREVTEIVRKWTDLAFDIKRSAKRKLDRTQRISPGSGLQVHHIVKDIMELDSDGTKKAQQDGQDHTSKSQSQNGDGKASGAPLSSEEENSDGGDGFEFEVDDEEDEGEGEGEGDEAAAEAPAAEARVSKLHPNTMSELLQSFREDEQESLFDTPRFPSSGATFELPSVDDDVSLDNRPSSSCSSSSGGSRLPRSTKSYTVHHTGATQTSSVKRPRSPFTVSPPAPAPSFPLPAVQAPVNSGGSISSGGTSKGGAGITIPPVATNPTTNVASVVNDLSSGIACHGGSATVNSVMAAPSGMDGLASGIACHGSSANTTNSVMADMGGLAAMSVQEQHMSNAMLETVSRSLELLSESLQTLAETQQEYMRESLQLQAQSVQALRDFASGAMTLIHEKLNSSNSGGGTTR